MFSASVVAFVAFVFAEKYAKLPVAPLNLFVQWKWRNVPIMLVTRCLLFFHLFATTFYLPLFLQVNGVSEINSGAHVIPFLSMAALSSAAVAHATSKYGYINHAFVTGLVILPVGLGLMTTLDETSSPGRIIGYSLICGLGFGPGTQISTVIPQAGLPEDVLPTVTALINTSASLGGVLGVGIIGSIVNNAFRKKLLHTLPSFTNANLNDVVKLVHDAPDLMTREVIVKAYVWAWRVGYWSLAGIAVLQFFMSLFLKPVDL
ncbi:MFS general substrate transporter, partial [Pluteus cervinus]